MNYLYKLRPLMSLGSIACESAKMRPLAIDVAWFVCVCLLSVCLCLLHTTVSPAKTAESIVMLFATKSRSLLRCDRSPWNVSDSQVHRLLKYWIYKFPYGAMQIGHTTVETSRFFASFYRAMLCIRGTSHGPVSVSVSVCHKSEFYYNG